MQEEKFAFGPSRLVTLFGRPGSGKTSVGNALAEEHGFLHLALGRLLRKFEILHEIGISEDEMARAVATGRTITNDRLYPWLDSRIAEARKPVVVDGYPRVPSAVASFNHLVTRFPTSTSVFAIHLICPAQTAGARVRHRARSDDLTTSLADRNDEYERVQRPLLSALSPRVQIVTIDASADLHTVIVEVVKALSLGSTLNALGRR